MRYEDLPSDEEMDRRGYLAYLAGRTVLGIRRDPSQRHPEGKDEIAWHCLRLAGQLVKQLPTELTHEDLLFLLPMMRGLWEADKEIGTEVRVW